MSLPIGRVFLSHRPHPFVMCIQGSRPAGRIVWQLRLPPASCGAAVRQFWRRRCVSGRSASLADPYLLGVAAAAGLGDAGSPPEYDRSGIVAPLPLAAFAGALLAVVLTYTLGASGERRRSATSLVLAGVAVASFLTAVQTWVQQRKSDTIREVFTWILGRLTTASWHDVLILLPYVVVTSAILIACGACRVLSVVTTRPRPLA